VVQLSLDRSQGPDFHFQVGRELQALRDEGVLILGSGNVVHNLRLVAWQGAPYDWAVEFDANVRRWIVAGENDPLIHYASQGQAADLSINSAEHYLPLLYVLGARQDGEPVAFFNEKIEAGSLSMRCVKVG
jgi:4,5-DOPA dioxygenase extradiol